MEKKVLAILFGGASPEHDISLQSAHAVITHLDTKKYAPVLVGIITAAVVGYFCIRLIRYLVVSDKFIVFSYYTGVLGVLTLVAGILEHIWGSNIVELVSRLL